MRKTVLTLIAAGALACGFLGLKAHAFADAPLARRAVAPQLQPAFAER